jgi:hypothetical protein
MSEMRRRTAAATALYSLLSTVVAVAFLATSWAALPLGVIAGSLYERSRS